MKVLVLGTSSGAGKTTFCAMLCNHFHRKGYSVSPFKASNLSLNSFATEDGGEIGMGQAFQAWSADIEPSVDMNPILMKPTGNGNMQLIVNGKPLRDIDKDNPVDRDVAMEHVMSALGRVSGKNDVVVCEGSGSPVELNIMDRDLANTGLMRAADIPAILVGDIERGGCFAAIYGTWLLIPEDIRYDMRGFVINRFRGDPDILAPAIDRICALTGMKYLGTLPYVGLRFPEEDSLSVSEGRMRGDDALTAFKDNISELTDIAESNGFDFDGLEEIMRSSA